VTSQRAHTKWKWPPYVTEWNLPLKISAYATGPKQSFISTNNKCLKDIYYGSGPQPFCNRGTVDAWQFYRGPGVLSQLCFYGKNRPITCPEGEWCHHQNASCNFAAPGLRTTALNMLRASVWRCFGYSYIGKKQCLKRIPNCLEVEWFFLHKEVTIKFPS